MSIQECSEPECAERQDGIDIVIDSKAKDLGELTVRRVLPSAARQRVGPFIFFDHMGPAEFAAGEGLAVRPHPHIGLATVTYLFDGVIQHRDSLGFDQPITPGAVNWMTAGRGIVHSERTPEDLLARGSKLHGLQVWLALPEDAEEIEPSFVHHPAGSLPTIDTDGVHLALVAGSAYGLESPVEVASPMFYLAGQLDSGAEIALPEEHEERGLYVVSGGVALNDVDLGVGSMAVARAGTEARATAREDSVVALAGGAPIAGERHLWWNFVSSSRERLESAKADWKEGRFERVPGDPEYIPLPE